MKFDHTCYKTREDGLRFCNIARTSIEGHNRRDEIFIRLQPGFLQKRYRMLAAYIKGTADLHQDERYYSRFPVVYTDLEK